MIGIVNLNNLTGWRSSQTHRLSTLVHPSILPSPIHHSYLHEVIQNPIGKDHGITGSKFLHNMNGISPEAIVKVALIEDVFGPMIFVEPQ